MESGISQFFRSTIERASLRYRTHCLLFLLLGSMWIILSDRMLLSMHFPADVLSLSIAQTVKGILFIMITSLFFYVFGRGHANRLKIVNHQLSHISDITKATHDIVWRSDPEGRSIEVLHASEKYVSTTPELLSEKLVHPDDREAEWLSWARHSENKKAFSTLVRLRVGEEYRHFVNHTFPILNDQGEIVEWMGACRDVEEFTQAQIALRKSEETLRLAAKAGAIGVWDWDLDNDSLSVSEEMRCQHGMDITRPKEIKKLIRADDYLLIRKAMLDAKYRSVPFEVEYRIETATGGTRWILNKGQAYSDGINSANRMLGVSIDITRIKETEERFRFLAHHDDLTRTPNRRRGMQMLEELIGLDQSETSGVVALILDIDYFSSLNETYGQKIGDIILRKTAERLRNILTDNEFLCRYAANAFLVIIPVNDANWRHRINVLENALHDRFFIAGQSLNVSISGGFARFPKNSISTDSLLRSAQLALQHAKESNRGHIEQYSDEMSEKSQRFEMVRNALLFAAQNNEFSINFQPQINLTDDALSGFEVLVRWRSANLGSVSPAEFIPVAEKIGIIGTIDNIILDKIGDQIKKWDAEDRNYGLLAFNLSPVVLEREGVAERIHVAALARGLGPSKLLLEVTETAMIRNSSVVFDNIEKLSKFGYSIAIDDFGTGFSSFENLTRLRPNKIKIDKSFIQSMDECLINAMLVRNLIRMAQDMGIQVVAEGVETENQLGMLLDWGCDTVQGYIYSRPLPAAEVESFLSWRGPHTVIDGQQMEGPSLTAPCI